MLSCLLLLASVWHVMADGGPGGETSLQDSLSSQPLSTSTPRGGQPLIGGARGNQDKTSPDTASAQLPQKGTKKSQWRQKRELHQLNFKHVFVDV